MVFVVSLAIYGDQGKADIFRSYKAKVNLN